MGEQSPEDVLKAVSSMAVVDLSAMVKGLEGKYGAQALADALSPEVKECVLKEDRA